MSIQLSSELQEHFGREQAFDRVIDQRGEVFRDVKGRKTLRFVANGRAYFVKVHHGVGWKEIFKNLVCFRLPILGARNEYAAIRRLEKLGIETMTIAGFGQRNRNPAKRESFLITEDLQNTISLEELCEDWPNNPPSFAFKRALIEQVATIAKTLHENGMNHRDFYICHFLLEQSSRKTSKPKLYLIDLHRALIHRRVPKRWLIKDIAGLFFSSMDIGLTQRDYFRFLRIYYGKPLRDILRTDATFWRTVSSQAARLYAKFQRKYSKPVRPEERKAAA